MTTCQVYMRSFCLCYHQPVDSHSSHWTSGDSDFPMCSDSWQYTLKSSTLVVKTIPSHSDKLSALCQCDVTIRASWSQRQQCYLWVCISLPSIIGHHTFLAMSSTSVHWITEVRSPLSADNNVLQWHQANTLLVLSIRNSQHSSC